MLWHFTKTILNFKVGPGRRTSQNWNLPWKNTNENIVDLFECKFSTLSCPENHRDTENRESMITIEGLGMVPYVVGVIVIS